MDYVNEKYKHFTLDDIVSLYKSIEAARNEDLADILSISLQKEILEELNERCKKGTIYVIVPTKWKLYGDLLDNVSNIQYVCASCHVSHASHKLTHWNEKEFCKALNIEPRSKTGRGNGDML